MADHIIWYVLGACALVFILRKAWVRLQLSRAKHRSLAGHARMARRFAGLVPYYEYGEERIFRADGAPQDDRRRAPRGLHAARRDLPSAEPEECRADRGGDRCDLGSEVHQPLPHTVSVQPLSCAST